MTKNEIDKAAADGMQVQVNIGGFGFSGVIVESGMMHMRIGPGTLQRSIVGIQTDNGIVYAHSKDVESSDQ